MTRDLTYLAAKGMNLIDWDRLSAWRSLCQQEGDSRDQSKDQRRIWQRRTKAARILCDFVWPKSGHGPREADFPKELRDEMYLAFCMGAAV